MLILEAILHQLLKVVPNVPPETGGIIGGRKGIISHFWLDFGNIYDMYIPNIERINQIISDWQETNIKFYGIFHSHFPGNENLSFGDKRYIIKIMKALPPDIKRLYFPIIFPRESMISYRAEINNRHIIIVREPTEII